MHQSKLKSVDNHTHCLKRTTKELGAPMLK